jgi:exopolysaccharide production protein ExoQ
MNPQLATVVYVAGILTLFWLDRDRTARTSMGLWVPTIWLLINASRPISQWFPVGPTIAADQYTEGSPLDAAVFGVLLLAALVVLVGRRQKIVRLLGSNLPILLFLGYCALSTLWSDYPFVAFKRWTKAVGDVAMIMIVLTEADPRVAIKRFLCRTGFVLLPLSILFIKYYPALGRSYNPWTWIPMYAGVTTFKNLLGMTCLVCGLGSVWCFVTAYKNRRGNLLNRHLVAHGVIIVMAVWLFFTADSMTSLSCFGMGSGLIVMTSQPWVARRPVLVHVLVLAIVCLALTALFLDTGGTLVQSLGRDASLTGRTVIWNAALSEVRNPMVGTGFESFWMGTRLDRIWEKINEPGIQEAHNGYLEVYLNLGAVGVTLLLIVIAAGYRNAIAVFRRDRDLGIVLLAYFVAGVVYSLTEAGFRMMSPVWIAFLLTLVIVPPSSLRRSPRSNNEETKNQSVPYPSETAHYHEEYV